MHMFRSINYLNNGPEFECKYRNIVLVFLYTLGKNRLSIFI